MRPLCPAASCCEFRADLRADSEAELAGVMAHEIVM